MNSIIYTSIALLSLLQPKALLVATETSPHANPEEQVQMKCFIEGSGSVSVVRITGFNENNEPVKVETVLTKKLGADTIKEIKNDLVNMKDAQSTIIGVSCGKGEVVLQGMNAGNGEMFDVFAARNCTDVTINTRFETQFILPKVREWCQMKIQPEITVPKVPSLPFIDSQSI